MMADQTNVASHLFVLVQWLVFSRCYFLLVRHFFSFVFLNDCFSLFPLFFLLICIHPQQSAKYKDSTLDLLWIVAQATKATVTSQIPIHPQPQWQPPLQNLPPWPSNYLKTPRVRSSKATTMALEVKPRAILRTTATL